MNQRLTGWTTYAVEVYGKDGERIEGLHGFAVLGRCGSVLWSKGQRIIVPAATPAGRATTGWRGLYFDADGWDGNDIFLPRNYGSVIVTERARAAVEDAGLKNFHFTRLTEFERTWPADEADDKTLN